MKKRKFIILLFLILFISIGFAILTSSLSLKSYISFKEHSFNVYLENVEIGNSTVTSPTVNIGDENNSITFGGTFNAPGDYMEFYFNIKNGGTINATLKDINSTLTEGSEDFITYTLTYEYNGEEVAENDMIYSGQSRRVKFHVEYKYDVNEFPSLQNLNITLSFKYIQPKEKLEISTWDYAYSGTEQLFYVPRSGTYKLEAWGAEGGRAYDVILKEPVGLGGYGGYSTGSLTLDKDTVLYINIGGKGRDCDPSLGKAAINGGYNGGGNGGYNNDSGYGGGGGAVHIALESGLLSTFQDKKSQLIMVSGSGGGAAVWHSQTTEEICVNNGGSGGGISGCDGRTIHFNNIGGKGGTQESGGVGDNNYASGEFGLGGYTTVVRGAGGGAGLYGGGVGHDYGSSAGGGSGYIGNSILKDKEMYCYKCSSSSADDTKTFSTDQVSSDPISEYAKIGNGHVRITKVS